MARPAKSWLAGDHHLGQARLLSFERDNGTPMRPGFKDMEEHDQYPIARHNEVVQPQDRVYLVGDVVINRKHLWKLGQLNGRKVLVKGNHDICKLKEYLPYVEDIRACVVGQKANYIISHIPILPDCLERFGTNFHAHLHYRKVPENKYKGVKYVCVSMEHLDDYQPVELKKLLNE